MAHAAPIKALRIPEDRRVLVIVVEAKLEPNKQKVRHCRVRQATKPQLHAAAGTSHHARGGPQHGPVELRTHGIRTEHGPVTSGCAGRSQWPELKRNWTSSALLSALLACTRMRCQSSTPLRSRRRTRVLFRHSACR